MMTTTTTTTVTAPVQRKHDQFSQWAQVVCGGGGGGDDGRRVCAPETGILSRAAAQAQYIIKVRRRGSCAKSVRMCDRMRPCSERSRFGWRWCASGAMVMMTRWEWRYKYLLRISISLQPVRRARVLHWSECRRRIQVKWSVLGGGEQIEINRCVRICGWKASCARVDCWWCSDQNVLINLIQYLWNGNMNYIHERVFTYNYNIPDSLLHPMINPILAVLGNTKISITNYENSINTINTGNSAICLWIVQALANDSHSTP